MTELVQSLNRFISCHVPANANIDSAQISTRFQYEDVVSSSEKTKEFLAHFMEYGLAFLADTPHQPEDLLQVCTFTAGQPMWLLPDKRN